MFLATWKPKTCKPNLGIFSCTPVCFPWRAGWQVFVSLDGHIWGWCFSLPYPHPWWNSCCAPSCSEPESGSMRDPTKILEFRILGSRQGEYNWHKEPSLTQKIPCYNLCLVCFPSEQSRIFAPDFTGKIGICNERWHNVLPRSITVSCLELVDNSWQVIYIALLLILPFISSVVNLLEVLLIRVVFANHMVYLY